MIKTKVMWHIVTEVFESEEIERIKGLEVEFFNKQPISELRASGTDIPFNAHNVRDTRFDSLVRYQI
jgi:hypothetical protein